MKGLQRMYPLFLFLLSLFYEVVTADPSDGMVSEPIAPSQVEGWSLRLLRRVDMATEPEEHSPLNLEGLHGAKKSSESDLTHRSLALDSFNDPQTVEVKCPQLLDDALMNNLQIYKANSANDGAYKELWIRGAGLFIPQVNVLLSKAVKHTVIMNTCDSFPVDSFTTLLGEHFNKYGSDKATSHHYYKVYGSILQDLGINNQLNLLEIGMGTNNPSLLSSMGKNGKPGASLRAFRDALPKSNIFGADVDEAILFTEDRITTVQVDQMDQDSFQKISAINSMFDLIIDDGLHSIAGNLNTMIWAMDHIKTGGYIVIEDIAYETNWNVIDYIMSNSHGWTNKMVSCSGLLYILQKIG